MISNKLKNPEVCLYRAVVLSVHPCVKFDGKKAVKINKHKCIELEESQETQTRFVKFELRLVEKFSGFVLVTLVPGSGEQGIVLKNTTFFDREPVFLCEPRSRN